MNSFSDKEKFIKMMAGNASYFNKQITTSHIVELLKVNPQLAPREAVRQSPNEGVFSFIQIYGYIPLGTDYYEILIGVPRSYPHAPPIFMIGIDRQFCEVYDEQKLLSGQLIAFEKNEKGDQYMRLRFPIIEKNWQPSKTSLASSYKNIVTAINHPVIIRSKNEVKKQSNNKINSDKSIKSQKSINKIKSKEVISAISNLYNDYADLLILKNGIAEDQEHINYSLCRHAFFQQIHLQHLNSQMQSYEQKLNSEIQKNGKGIRVISYRGSIDTLLDKTKSNEQQLRKLQVMSEHQALKDAEAAVRTRIQSSDSHKFADYKKIMKVLFDKMFDNQTETLKMS